MPSYPTRQRISAPRRSDGWDNRRPANDNSRSRSTFRTAARPGNPANDNARANPPAARAPRPRALPLQGLKTLNRYLNWPQYAFDRLAIVPTIIKNPRNIPVPNVTDITQWHMHYSGVVQYSGVYDTPIMVQQPTAFFGPNNGAISGQAGPAFTEGVGPTYPESVPGAYFGTSSKLSYRRPTKEMLDGIPGGIYRYAQAIVFDKHTIAYPSSEPYRRNPANLADMQHILAEELPTFDISANVITPWPWYGYPYHHAPNFAPDPDEWLLTVPNLFPPGKQPWPTVMPDPQLERWLEPLIAPAIRPIVVEPPMWAPAPLEVPANKPQPVPVAPFARVNSPTVPVNRVTHRPGQRPRRDPGAQHNRKRPGRNTKERKGKMEEIAFMAMNVFGGLTEFLDVVTVLHSALPDEYQEKAYNNGRRIPPSWQRQIRAVYQHFDKLNLDKAAWGLLSDYAQDWVIGNLARGARLPGTPAGINRFSGSNQLDSRYDQAPEPATPTSPWEL